MRIEPIENRHIDLIYNNIHRSQLRNHEYLFLENSQLKDYLKKSILNTISNSNSYSFVSLLGENVLGYINCDLNQFDSNNFGFNCYRITDLLVFSNDYNEIREIVKSLINSTLSKLSSVSRSYYIATSINNNTFNQDKILNSLIENGFYYIHTLLTFKLYKEKFEAITSFDNDKIKIRVADCNDVEQVSVLAEKSFKYSRFHLDPFLDNNKASKLLKQSAENSILQGFVDVMFVAEINDKIVGYYSAKKRDILEFEMTIGEVVISAVDSDYRGLGIFSKMDNCILNWFSVNTHFSEMGTYLANYPVHKTWINKGLGLVRGSHQLSMFIK